MAPKALEAGKEAHGISQELLNVRIERQLAAMSARMEAYEKKPTQEKAHIAEKCTELELFLNGNVPEMTLMDVILFLQGQLKKCFRCIYVEECLSLAHMQKLLEILYQSCERAIQKQKQMEQGKRELDVLLADAHEKIRRLEAQIQKKTKPPVSILPFSHQKTRSKDSENPMFFGDPEGVALMAAMMPCTPTLLCNKTGAAGVVVSEYTDAIETKTPEKGLRRCLICGGKLDTGELVFDAPASAFADGRYLNSDIQIHQTCADYNPDIAIGFVSNMLRILK
ncbi:MAG: hypothetical protein GY862_33195, partial [Gammaproteobacteria bacterium]|nr:hypothetical protein [Gammaproteobacteria bacterium]